MKRNVVALTIALLSVILCGTVLAQISPTAPPKSKITPLGPHAQQPPGRAVSTGTIYGFVYWDAKATSHLGSSVCNALAITVVVANKGSYSPFTVVGTQSHFTSIATVHPPLTSVNTTSYDGCAYLFDNAPLGQKLYATLSLTQSIGTLTPAVVAKDSPVGPVQFSSAMCTSLPPLTKATAGDLTGQWASCQNVAYHVNFPLVQTGQLTIQSAGGGFGENQGGSRGAVVQANSGSPQASLLTNAGPQNSPGLLGNANPSQGMLGAVNPGPTNKSIDTPKRTASTSADVGISPVANTHSSTGTLAPSVHPTSRIPQPCLITAFAYVVQMDPSNTLVGGTESFNVGMDPEGPDALSVPYQELSAWNINRGASWPAGTTHKFVLPLAKPLPAEEFRGIDAVGFSYLSTAHYPAKVANRTVDYLAVIAMGPGLNALVAERKDPFTFTATDSNLWIKPGTYLGCGLPDVTSIYFDFRTGTDDLRGGNDNLNIVIFFADGSRQFVNNVNSSQTWANRSTHTLKVNLNRPVPQNQITGITLTTTAGGGLSGDNWAMALVRVTADIGSSKGLPIAFDSWYEFRGPPDNTLSLKMMP